MNTLDRKNQSHKIMNGITLFSAAALVIFAVLNQIADAGVFLSLAITFGTVFYHFAMRLAVGYGTMMIKCSLNYKNCWFRQKKFEIKLYQKLKVKSWKDKMPTYNPSTFSISEHTVEEVIQTMCISEIGHELNAALSFVPLLFAVIWGEFPVFLITSIIGGMVDMPFVIMQRYNRPRLVRVLEKRKR